MVIGKKGFLLTIEGVEGAGKSTLAALLQEHLAATGVEIVVSAEPGGGPVSERIRKLLLDSVSSISDRAELLLFEAARAQHVNEIILPALQRGAVVICDRFTDSSLAYQGYARGLDLDMVRTLNDYATRGLKPDLTLLLDLPAQDGLKRQRRTDRVSSEGIAFHVAVREGFLSVAKSEPERFAIIDATQPLEAVARQAAEAVEARMAAAGCLSRKHERGKARKEDSAYRD